MNEKVLEMTIEELDLSVRTYNCLKRAGYDTIEKICNATEKELISKASYLGIKSLQEIFQKLQMLGLDIKQDPNPSGIVDEEENGIDKYNLDNDADIDLYDDFEVSKTNVAFASNTYCDSTNCDFREVCSLDKTYCVKKHFDVTLQTLTSREEKVLKLYYGIDCERRKNSLEISEELHIAREQIFKIKKKALRKLRHKSRAKFIKALFPTIFAITKDTPYSRLAKKIFELEESNRKLFQTEILQPMQKECIKNAGFDEI